MTTLAVHLCKLHCDLRMRHISNLSNICYGLKPDNGQPWGLFLFKYASFAYYLFVFVLIHSNSLHLFAFVHTTHHTRRWFGARSLGILLYLVPALCIHFMVSCNLLSHGNTNFHATLCIKFILSHCMYVCEFFVVGSFS